MTVVALVIVRVQVPVPEHPPLQPENVEPLLGTAARVTDVPVLNPNEQVTPQLIPAGVLVTVPEPVPLGVTVKVTPNAKVAVTDVALFMGTVQAPVPVQAPPLQPVKVEPLSATAVKVTEVPVARVVGQVEPQLIPAGVLGTVPEPVPALVTVRP